MGDLTKQAALDECHRVMAANDGVTGVLKSDALKANRYWEVSGTHGTGTFRCVVSAVSGEVVISSWGTG